MPTQDELSRRRSRALQSRLALAPEAGAHLRQIEARRKKRLAILSGAQPGALTDFPVIEELEKRSSNLALKFKLKKMKGDVLRSLSSIEQAQTPRDRAKLAVDAAMKMWDTNAEIRVAALGLKGGVAKEKLQLTRQMMTRRGELDDRFTTEGHGELEADVSTFIASVQGDFGVGESAQLDAPSERTMLQAVNTALEGKSDEDKGRMLSEIDSYLRQRGDAGITLRIQQGLSLQEGTDDDRKRLQGNQDLQNVVIQTQGVKGELGALLERASIDEDVFNTRQEVDTEVVRAGGKAGKFTDITAAHTVIQSLTTGDEAAREAARKPFLDEIDNLDALLKEIEAGPTFSSDYQASLSALIENPAFAAYMESQDYIPGQEAEAAHALAIGTKPMRAKIQAASRMAQTFGPEGEAGFLQKTFRPRLAAEAESIAAGETKGYAESVAEARKAVGAPETRLVHDVRGEEGKEATGLSDSDLEEVGEPEAKADPLIGPGQVAGFVGGSVQPPDALAAASGKPEESRVKAGKQQRQDAIRRMYEQKSAVV